MIAIVTTATQVDVSASSTTAPSITIVTADGNTIVGFASIYDANTTFTVSSTSDGGNTWTTRSGNADLGGASSSWAVVSHAENITGGSRTVAFNLTGATGPANRYYSLGALEFSGVVTSAAEDAQDANEQIDTTATLVNAGPITTTNTTDLIVGCATIVTIADNALNFGSPTSWTNKYRQNDGAGIIGMDAGYWLPGAIQTTYTPTWAHDLGGNVGAGVVVALLAAVAAESSPAGPQRSSGQAVTQMPG